MYRRVATSDISRSYDPLTIDAHNMTGERGMDLRYLLTSFNGRIGRRLFWLALLYMMGLQLLLFAVAAGLVKAICGLDVAAVQRIGLVLNLVSIVPMFALISKRLHDRDYPSYVIALPVIPSVGAAVSIDLGISGEAFQLIAIASGAVGTAIGVWLFVELGFLRGTVGSNRFGPERIDVGQRI
jgi:uncharacterized membrane protein YhaH (DUF805 family)